jgi:hypothetical protein
MSHATAPTPPAACVAGSRDIELKIVVALAHLWVTRMGQGRDERGRHASGKISRSVTHPKIASGQARLTPKFFTVGLPEKKVYLVGMSILLILLSLEPGCHNPPP